MHKLYIIELPSGLEYMNNFLSVYGIYNPPVARETRVKWGTYVYSRNCDCSQLSWLTRCLTPSALPIFLHVATVPAKIKIKLGMKTGS